MIEVSINDDISEYEEKITPIMTMKQCIIVGVTMILSLPIFLIIKNKLGYQVAGYSIIPFVSIGFAFGFIKYQGMTFKNMIISLCNWCFFRPRKRVYKTENIYDYISLDEEKD